MNLSKHVRNVALTLGIYLLRLDRNVFSTFVIET